MVTSVPLDAAGRRTGPGRSLRRRRWSHVGQHDGGVPAAVLAHLAATCAYAGFQWTIRVVAYPQLAKVPGEPFGPYLEAYQRRVTYLVGPLFGALVLATGWLALTGGVPVGARLLAVALLAALLATTGLLAVPAHRGLSRGWDPAAHRRLLRVDGLRVVTATVSAALGLMLAAGRLSP